LWLIGSRVSTITGCKLPSKRQVFARFLQLHSEEKLIIQESARLTITDILPFWEKARIPTKQDYHVIEKVKGLDNEWQKLKENCTRRTKRKKTKENVFVDAFNYLFDVAHAEALQLIKIPEDSEFLRGRKADEERWQGWI